METQIEQRTVWYGLGAAAAWRRRERPAARPRAYGRRRSSTVSRRGGCIRSQRVFMPSGGPADATRAVDGRSAELRAGRCAQPYRRGRALVHPANRRADRSVSTLAATPARHRRAPAQGLEQGSREHQGIPVTSPVCTLRRSRRPPRRIELEAAINEADKLDLVSPEQLRSALDSMARRPGHKALRDMLDRQTFVLTDSELERLFLPHRRARQAATAADRRVAERLQGRLLLARLSVSWSRPTVCATTARPRSRRRTAAATRPTRPPGSSVLRFTHAQVEFEPNHVRATLAAVTRIRP